MSKVLTPMESAAIPSPSRNRRKSKMDILRNAVPPFAILSRPNSGPNLWERKERDGHWVGTEAAALAVAAKEIARLLEENDLIPPNRMEH